MSHWQPQAQDEVTRLTAANVLSDKGMQIIEDQVKTRNLLNAHKVELIAVMGKATEIRTIYERTHYIFTHANSGTQDSFFKMQRELLRLNGDSRFNELSMPLGNVHDRNSAKNLNEFRKKPNTSYLNNYTDFHQESFVDWESELVSVDTSFWNVDEAESAIYYLIQGTDFCEKFHDFTANYMTVFNSYLKDSEQVQASEVKELVESLAKRIGTFLHNCSARGAFYLICIPKDVVENTPDADKFFYRAHPYGTICKCYKEDEVTVLDSLQNDHTQLACKMPHNLNKTYLQEK